MIRLNDTTYFIDSEGNRVEKYTSSCKLKQYNFVYETFINYGGQIVAKVNGINETVDYPYYNRLVKAGYIVYKDTDLHHIEDREEGLRIRRSITTNINLAIQYIFNSEEMNEIKSNVFTVDSDKYLNTIMYDTVDKMVQRNMNRKDNNLKFYPYDKDICKYGSMYLALFAEPKDQCKPDIYNFSSNFTKKLMSVLGNEYHFVNLPVKSKIIYTEEI